jgi:hypothetical protein
MQEIPGNMGFKDHRFDELMVETGWQKGQAWCAYFCELVWKLAYEKDTETAYAIEKLFAAGAVKTYNNFKAYQKFPVDKKPEIGAVAIWQTWKDNQPFWTGHAGIVVKILGGNEVLTIEGNTNSKGGREGIEVCEKNRRLSFDTHNGLVLKGFIHAI